MSLRAYKIQDIKTEDEPAFNLGKNYNWLEALSCWSARNQNDECVMIEFEVENLERALWSHNYGAHSYSVSEKKVIERILEDRDKDGGNFITYYCY